MVTIRCSIFLCVDQYFFLIKFSCCLKKLSFISYNLSQLMMNSIRFCCCCSVAKPCTTLWDPMDFSMPGFPVLHCLPEIAQTHVHWVNDAIQPSVTSFSCPYLSRIRVFYNESALFIRWPRYWSLSFSISSSSEHSRLISFRIDWFDLHAVQQILKSLL